MSRLLIKIILIKFLTLKNVYKARSAFFEKKIFSNGVRMEHIHIDLRRAVLLTTENFMDY